MEVWCGRRAAADASLLVWGSTLAERVERSTNALTGALKAIVTVVAKDSWISVEVAVATARVMVAHLCVEAALHEQANCPRMCSGAPDCLHSLSFR